VPIPSKGKPKIDEDVAPNAVPSMSPPRWPKRSAQRQGIDPKTGRSAMGVAVIARQAELVSQGYERISNGLLTPEASAAWRSLKDAGLVESRIDALNQGVLLLKATKLRKRK